MNLEVWKWDYLVERKEVNQVWEVWSVQASVCSLLLDYDFNDNIICLCKAKELLGIEHYSSEMFSDSKISEKYLKGILLKINRNNYDSIEIL